MSLLQQRLNKGHLIKWEFKENWGWVHFLLDELNEDRLIKQLLTISKYLSKYWKQSNSITEMYISLV